MPTPAPEESVIELRFATPVPETGGKHRYGHAPWAKRVEEATNGKVKMVLFPGGSLAGSKDMYDAVVGGITDIGWFDAAMAAGRFKLITGIYSMPGAGIGDATIASWVIWNLYKNTPEIQAEFSPVQVLFLHAFAPLAIASKSVPIRSMDDVKGLKLRAPPGGTAELVDLAGGTVVSMVPPEIYVSMERGILDGNIMGWEGHGAFNITELAKYFTPVPAFGGPQFVMAVNKDKWNSLPDDVKKGILSVSGDEGALLYGRGGDKSSQEVTDQIKSLGGEIIQMSPVEEERWNALAKPLQEKILTDLKAKGLPADKTWQEMLRLVKQYKQNPVK
jgi:TRAP-type C4-dicarboxylate transport system substrate-binding protein